MATNRASQLLTSGTPDSGHIPTQPFGTRGVASTSATEEHPQAVEEHPASETRFNPFRFLVPELPTSMRQEQLASRPSFVPVERRFHSKPPNAGHSVPERGEALGAPESHPALPSADQRRLPIRINWTAVLYALVLAAFASPLVFWPDDSNRPERVIPRSEPPPTAHRVSQASPPAKAVTADSEPVTPMNESQSPTHESQSPTHESPSSTHESPSSTHESPSSTHESPSSTHESQRPSLNSAPRTPVRAPSAPSAAVRHQSSPLARPTVPASDKANKESVLGSVLAPPPA